MPPACVMPIAYLISRVCLIIYRAQKAVPFLLLWTLRIHPLDRPSLFPDDLLLDAVY